MYASIDTSELHTLAAHQSAHADTVPEKARGIVARGGHRTVAASQVNAPVDTGELKGDISVDIDEGGLGFEAGPTVEHGLYQELGTSEMSAQPYLGPGFDQTLPLLLGEVGDLGDGIG